MSPDHGPLPPGTIPRACFFGAGECDSPATHWTWTGEGEEIDHCCERHLEMLLRWEKKIDDMPPEVLQKFSTAVYKAHKEQDSV